MKELTYTGDSRLADWIGIVVIFLMGLGTVFVFSAGATVGQGPDLRRLYEYPAMRQILFYPLAVAVMYAVSRMDYRRFSLEAGWWRSFTPYLFLLALILLVIVLIPNLGTEINRARRWLRVPVGPVAISFQPSELAKWSTVLFLAAVCTRMGVDVRRYWLRFLPLCLVVALVVGLIIVEDFGTAAFIALVSFILLIAAGVRWWHILTLIPPALVGFVAALIASPHRLVRLAAFLWPDRWGASASYQATQSLVAIGSGGLWGKGLGLGICKYGHLPEDTTDFIFAIVGEELGFVGTAAVVGLFIVLMILGMVVVVRASDRFGRLLAAGIVLTIGLQAALNMGVVTVVLPTKGIPLPFVSAGGTSMLASAAGVGVLMSIARHRREVPE